MLSATLAQRLNETLLWLCAIDSPIGEERALCDAVQARIDKLPVAALTERIGDSLVVALGGGASPEAGAARRPRIALAGHLDTVRTENGPARIEGDRCFGAGASDMKSGLATMLVLAETVPPSLLTADLVLVFYAREEGPFAENELGPVLERSKLLAGVDLAVCLEPSDNRLHLGCCGSIHATLTFEGKTGHSARPWEGDNAVTKALPLLAELARRPPRESRIGGLVYRTVTTVTQARDGGRGRYVVPDRFVVNLNHRFSPDTSLAAAQDDVLSFVGGRARVEFVDLSPAAMPNGEHPLVRALVGSGVVGIDPKQAWTDVARFAARGVPAVNFGPGENAQAHKKNESTSLSLVHDGYSIMNRWLTSPELAARQRS
jgi:succinyl-diaminopimelate desuccinylase